MTQPTPARFGLLLVLLAALFAAALAIGKVSAPSGSAVTPAPVQLHVQPAAAPAVSAPPTTSALPALRHPAPKPKPVQATAPGAPASSAPAPTPTPAPTPAPAPSAPTGRGGSSGGGGGGSSSGGGGGVILSG